MIPFAEAAFRAETLGVAKSGEGKVLHATIRIGSGTFKSTKPRMKSQLAPCYLLFTCRTPMPVTKRRCAPAPFLWSRPA